MGDTNKKLTVITEAKDLQELYDGSAYTIAGTGGDINEWITGVTDLLEKDECGTPEKWFQFTGKQVNEFAGRIKSRSAEFQDDLTFLAFHIDCMHLGRLAMFKLAARDRWFDDIIDNMRD